MMPEPPIGAAIAFLGLHEVPAEYVAAVKTIRKMRAVNTAYARPTLKPGGDALNACGSSVKEGRRVQVDVDPLAHLRRAQAASIEKVRQIRLVDDFGAQSATILFPRHMPYGNFTFLL